MFFKIYSIQTLDRAEAGDQAGILVKGLKRNEIKRGMVGVLAGSQKPARSVKATVSILY